MSNTKKIDVAISYIRLIAVIMIITCHILQGLNLEAAFWFNLGVQIFLFMSGFLYGKKEIKDVKQYYKKQLIKIGLPYVILLIICVILEKFYVGISYSKTYLIGNLLGFQGIYGNIKTLSHTWYISYILICYLITPLLQMVNIENKSQKQFIKFVLGLIFVIQLFQFYRVINLSVAWICTYILGYFFSKYYIKGKVDSKKFISYFVIITMFFLPFRIIIQYNPFNLNLPNFILANSTLIMQWSHAMLGATIFLITYYLLKRFKFPYNRLLKFSDKYSYYVYLVHQIFILNCFSLLKITNNLFINCILIILFTIISAIMLHFLSNQIIKFLKKIGGYFNGKITKSYS